jgi:hypothetical protein
MVRRSAGDQAERDGPDRFADSDGEEEDD